MPSSHFELAIRLVFYFQLFLLVSYFHSSNISLFRMAALFLAYPCDTLISSANNLLLGQWLYQLNQLARTETSGTLPIEPYIIFQGDLAGGFISANLVQMLQRLSPSVNHLQRLYYTHFTTLQLFKP
ncbi:hypothetical protein M441DRAFT_314652 [Trichoderma asperellum CBS 433.97]|uniref:Uncharacterized protein n=1 Tax=Trichoderma asperellum (strain ATCC 204424 / CBS 433.97 / NBRC 101777) TaxID=1042311 RepID=A0A2T3ZKH8_TRIA4|nr:hypothetical protein M441DRAFT_314652 [Trichoderma asperellum CBS 433.97]PTB45318.1 hypothetical protein M441DRAFT_314652 [Trichoderma asperellum CBS 433.97]